MMKNYGTPASEGDVQRAQFLNYLKAPKPLQQAMQQYSPSSDAYMKLQNSMASAQEDMGIRQGTPQPARDFLASQQSPQGQVQAADLVQRTVGGLGPNHPLTTMLSPQGEAERAARRQERLERRTTVPQQPVNARGVAGATFGTVNGQQMLVPEAGQYGQFRQSMGQLGLDGTMGVERGAFEGARSKLVAQQEAGRRGEKDLARREGNKAHTRALELAGVKAARGAGQSGDSVEQSGEKKGQAAYFRDRTKYVSDMRTAKGLQARLQQKLTSPDVDPELDTIKVGNIEMTLAEAEAWSENILSDPGPQKDQYFTVGAPNPKPGGQPGPKGPGMFQKLGNALFGDGGQQASAPTGKPNTKDIDPADAAEMDGLDAADLPGAIAAAEDPANRRPPGEAQYLRWRLATLQGRPVAGR